MNLWVEIKVIYWGKEKPSLQAKQNKKLIRYDTAGRCSACSAGFFTRNGFFGRQTPSL